MACKFFTGYMCHVADMTTAQIEAENTQMTNDLYRLLKKYSGLRNLIRELKVLLFVQLRGISSHAFTFMNLILDLIMIFFLYNMSF